jgi:predicted ATPase
MITRLELDGFKTFSDVAFDIAPFQIFIGPSGAGKSNLFDALLLLSHLAGSDLRSAFQEVRCEPRELFTQLADGTTAARMRIAAEMLVSSHVEDDWGAQADVKYTRMRYEIAIERRMDERGIERLYVAHEALLPIQRSDDPWARRHIGRGRERWLPTLRTGRTVPFLSTIDVEGTPTIYLHQDGRGGDRAAVAHGAERTVLSTVSNTEFPHAFAARQEMRKWRVLDLHADAIRAAGSFLPHSYIASDGGNLHEALARIKAESPYALERVARDLVAVVPGLAGLDVNDGYMREGPVIRLKRDDGHIISPGLLSGGALRLLALVTLKNDPDEGGVLCLEEPENGLDAPSLRRALPLLRGMSTDLDRGGEGEYLRQMLLGTHSADLVRELVRLLGREEELPVHDLPEVLYVRAEKRGEGHPAMSLFSRIRPSQQLELGLDGPAGADVQTLAELESALG